MRQLLPTCSRSDARCRSGRSWTRMRLAVCWWMRGGPTSR
nr:MAG TPA: hypothetical protein [Caudoviricetes sp.]DAN77522.1 MAG TPA: hypothetical protein [Bacteriophage sp.]DAQ67907.1 MAG TPA: hypothetical protein [Caudoviricetes sp.]DAR15503.1 MAG TPA: hypothetical protein [Caudoviricetes sp.]